MAMRSHKGNDRHSRSRPPKGRQAPVVDASAGRMRPLNSPAAAHSGNHHHGAPSRKVIPPTRTPPAAPTQLATIRFGAVHPSVVAVVKISTLRGLHHHT